MSSDGSDADDGPIFATPAKLPAAAPGGKRGAAARTPLSAAPDARRSRAGDAAGAAASADSPPGPLAPQQRTPPSSPAGRSGHLKRQRPRSEAASPAIVGKERGRQLQALRGPPLGAGGADAAARRPGPRLPGGPPGPPFESPAQAAPGRRASGPEAAAAADGAATSDAEAGVLLAWALRVAAVAPDAAARACGGDPFRVQLLCRLVAVARFALQPVAAAAAPAADVQVSAAPMPWAASDGDDAELPAGEFVRAGAVLVAAARVYAAEVDAWAVGARRLQARLLYSTQLQPGGPGPAAQSPGAPAAGGDSDAPQLSRAAAAGGKLAAAAARGADSEPPPIWIDRGDREETNRTGADSDSHSGDGAGESDAQLARRSLISAAAFAAGALDLRPGGASGPAPAWGAAAAALLQPWSLAALLGGSGGRAAPGGEGAGGCGPGAPPLLLDRWPLDSAGALRLDPARDPIQDAADRDPIQDAADRDPIRRAGPGMGADGIMTSGDIDAYAPARTAAARTVLQAPEGFFPGVSRSESRTDPESLPGPGALQAAIARLPVGTVAAALRRLLRGDGPPTCIGEWTDGIDLVAAGCCLPPAHEAALFDDGDAAAGGAGQGCGPMSSESSECEPMRAAAAAEFESSSGAGAGAAAAVPEGSSQADCDGGFSDGCADECSTHEPQGDIDFDFDQDDHGSDWAMHTMGAGSASAASFEPRAAGNGPGTGLPPGPGGSRCEGERGPGGLSIGGNAAVTMLLATAASAAAMISAAGARGPGPWRPRLLRSGSESAAAAIRVASESEIHHDGSSWPQGDLAADDLSNSRDEGGVPPGLAAWRRRGGRPRKAARGPPPPLDFRRPPPRRFACAAAQARRPADIALPPLRQLQAARPPAAACAADDAAVPAVPCRGAVTRGMLAAHRAASTCERQLPAEAEASRAQTQARRLGPRPTPWDESGSDFPDPATSAQRSSIKLNPAALPTQPLARLWPHPACPRGPAAGGTLGPALGRGAGAGCACARCTIGLLQLLPAEVDPSDAFDPARLEASLLLSLQGGAHLQQLPSGPPRRPGLAALALAFERAVRACTLRLRGGRAIGAPTSAADSDPHGRAAATARAAAAAAGLYDAEASADDSGRAFGGGDFGAGGGEEDAQEPETDQRGEAAAAWAFADAKGGGGGGRGPRVGADAADPPIAPEGSAADAAHLWAHAAAARAAAAAAAGAAAGSAPRPGLGGEGAAGLRTLKARMWGALQAAWGAAPGAGGSGAGTGVSGDDHREEGLGLGPERARRRPLAWGTEPEGQAADPEGPLTSAIIAAPTPPAAGFDRGADGDGRGDRIFEGASAAAGRGGATLRCLLAAAAAASAAAPPVTPAETPAAAAAAGSGGADLADHDSRRIDIAGAAAVGTAARAPPLPAPAPPSVALCFLCLLHLASEQGLTLVALPGPRAENDYPSAGGPRRGDRDSCSDVLIARREA